MNNKIHFFRDFTPNCFMLFSSKSNRVSMLVLNLIFIPICLHCMNKDIHHTKEIKIYLVHLEFSSNEVKFGINSSSSGTVLYSQKKIIRAK